ncbi:MAG: type VII toxin-antitoxin system HepT family RNase toxin [Candidatus Xenobia bacterium]
MDVLDPDLLASWCQRLDLDMVVLFGSRAQGREQPHSDIDLAIMPASVDADQETSWRVTCALVDGLRRGDLDVIWLPTASWLLTWEVAQHGRVVYERHPGLFHQFWLQAALRRADSRLWRRRDADFLNAVLGGSRVLDADLVHRKLALLAQYLQQLEEVLQTDAQRFASDYRIHRIAERQVELMVECAAAINTEVSQSVAGIPPSDYYSSFFSLHQAGWVDAETAHALALFAGLRNRLVHQYEAVQLPRLFDTAVSALPHWRTYLASVRDRLQHLQPG